MRSASWPTGGIVFVNTPLIVWPSCLATPQFQMLLWKPPFISALIDEDRCHLNGLAMEDGEAALRDRGQFVPTLSMAGAIAADGGIVIDVQYQ